MSVTSPPLPPARPAGRPPLVQGLSRQQVAHVLRDRGLHVAVVLWVLACAGLLLLSGGDPLPVQRGAEPPSAVAEVVSEQLNLLVALVVIAVALVLTRHRAPVDLAARAPARARAGVETAALLVYAAVVTAGGLLLGQAAGEHAISLHLPGTIHGLHGDTLAAGWVALWAGYNLLLWAVVPYVWKRRLGYSTTQLGLRSSDRRGDAVLIVAVLALESASS